MRIQGNDKRQEQPDTNLSYKDYKTQQQKKIRQQNIMMFLSIFVVLLLIFLGVARLLSPDIDITLGDEHSKSNIDEEYTNSGIDPRLKALQKEDEMRSLPNENASEIEEDGIVKIPKQEDRSLSPLEEEKLQTSNNTPTTGVTIAPPVPAEAEIITLRPNASNDTSVSAISVPQQTHRVYVGMYSTQAQAEVARGILQDAGLGLTPHIKQTAGGYTLQVGAFSSKTTATNLSNKLLMNNYPARVVSE